MALDGIGWHARNTIMLLREIEADSLKRMNVLV
jgi:hypothetical protein